MGAKYRLMIYSPKILADKTQNHYTKCGVLQNEVP